MNKMIVANLVQRPIRSVISVVAVAVEVTLILLIVGLALGILNDNKERQKGTGADILVRPPGSANFSAFSSAPVSVRVGDVIAKQPHVAVVCPVVMQTTNNIEILTGIDTEKFEELGGPLRYLEGGPFQGPYDMLVDDYIAASEKLHPGKIVKRLGHDFRVSGIIPHGRGGRRYIPMKTLQDLIGMENKATLFYVKLDDPHHDTLVAQEIKSIPGMENYNVMTISEWLAIMSADNIPGLSIFIKVVIGIAMVIGFIVILKSLGASKSYVVRVILRETLLLAVTGILVGFIFSVAGRAGIVHSFPTLRILPITWKWALYATLIAIGGAMLGAIYPAFKAAQKDPIDALAYE